MTTAPSRTAPATDAAALDHAVLKTVAYGDVFEYPLRDAEVHRYLHGLHATPADTDAALARATAPDGPLSVRDGYYTLRGREALIDARQERAARAARLWPRAVRYGRVLASLPFVRLVAVTGSLAWDNVPRGADIDYLVVTEPDRLWTSRWLIALVKRLARLRGVTLCPNYIVSTRALAALQSDLYGAYELSSMVPLAGTETYQALRGANAWTLRYLPNAAGAPSEPAMAVTRGFARTAERLLRTRLGAAIERYEMRYRRGKIRRLRLRAIGRDGARRGEGAHTVDRCIWFGGGHRLRALAAFDQRLQQLRDAQ